jgi:hypothetical protein
MAKTYDIPAEPGNFLANGKKYVVRCYSEGCGDGPRGRENYLPAAASGKCAWCGSDGSRG